MDIFFSYRRKGGIELTRNLKMALSNLGYTAFFDTDSVREGKFNEQILKNIESADNFVLILTAHALDECAKPSNWVRREIEAALCAGKHIIPVICEGFELPENLPESIQQVAQYQGVYYNPMQFEAAVQQLILYLKDSEGNPLRLTKQQNVSNTYYEDGHMSQEERKRIRLDYESVKEVETRIWDSLLKDRGNGIVIFAPAIYDIKTYMKKYDRPEFAHVYGMVNSEEEQLIANDSYGFGRNRFYVGNMENDDFDELLDQILEDNDIEGFDFVDLTLILRDLKEPGKKLREIVERMNSGGIVYVREFDHGVVQAYPDDQGKFRHLLDLIHLDNYSGDFYAGRKIYSQMRDAYLENITLANECITTLGLSRKQKETLFEALFSYVPREFDFLAKREPHNKQYHDAVAWLKENYLSLKHDFLNEDFFYRAGHMFMYGFVM